jgi:hypothetical protein
MDLYEAFPSLINVQHSSLFKRDLRLISLSGFVYDDDALYFEISPDKYWGRLSQGNSAIGIRLPKVNPDGMHPPYKALMQYLREVWSCDTNLYPPGYALIMDENDQVSLLPDVNSPFMLQMTRPRLGGSIVPDALVQVAFLLPVKRFNWQSARTHVDLVRISRDRFDTFLEQDMWPISDLVSQPWCDLKVHKPLPQDAVARIVLTLRSLRELLRADKIKPNFLDSRTSI